jgi:glycosyltransferase involved in cell wall biosynthesis
MRIGLYTAFLTPGQIGGTETYVRQLVAHLGQVDRRNRYTLFVTGPNRHLFAGLPANFEPAQISLLPPGSFIMARLMHKLGLLSAYATRQMQRYPLDLLHYPGTTLDQLAIKFPCVLTVQDIQHEYFPEFFSPETLAWRRANFKPSMVKANQLITASQYTRQTVIDRYSLPPQTITAIPYGIGQQFSAVISLEVVAQTRQRYQLPPQFIYYPANFWPHKNHRRLFEALVQLKTRYNLTVPLVLSGVFQGQADLSALIAELDLTGQVHLLGYLPHSELPALYAAATALVFPSLFEGFGLPVLEAMACGCPVICANTTSLPELAGEAALAVNPLDVAQMAEAIYNILNSVSLQRELRQKGLAQVKNFSWTRTAQQTVEVYDRAVNG